MSKIATEQEAYNIGKLGTPVTNKCCTKERAEELGCKVNGSYSSNQLVQLSDLTKNLPEYNIYIGSSNALNYMVSNKESSWSQNFQNTDTILMADIYGYDFSEGTLSDGVVLKDDGELALNVSFDSDTESAFTTNGKFDYELYFVVRAPNRSNIDLNNTQAQISTNSMMFNENFFIDLWGEYQQTTEYTFSGTIEIGGKSYSVANTPLIPFAFGVWGDRNQSWCSWTGCNYGYGFSDHGNSDFQNYRAINITADTDISEFYAFDFYMSNVELYGFELTIKSTPW